MGCIALAAWMQEITRLRTPQAAPEPEAMPYLLNQLESIELSKTATDQLRQRSRQLKAAEEKDRESRRKALTMSGLDGQYH
jgi:hypothetical protein